MDYAGISSIIGTFLGENYAGIIGTFITFMRIICRFWKLVQVSRNHNYSINICKPDGRDESILMVNYISLYLFGILC